MCDQHEFLFDVDKAYADQLLTALKGSPSHPLAAHEAKTVIGVYALFRGDPESLVYIGEALGTAGLRSRLNDHAGKIRGRNNIDLNEVSCRYLTMGQRWEVARAEDVLIKLYDPPWNKITGFGMHVPGSGRPGLPGYSNQWDQLFPKK